MSCILTSGYKLPCQNFMAGLQAIYIAPFANVESITYTTSGSGQMVSAISLSASTYFYEFDLTKQNSEYVENLMVMPTLGTSAYEQVVTLYLSQYATATKNQVNLLAQSKTMIIVQDRNSQYWLLGITNGMNLDESNVGNVGKAYLSDPNGWTLTLKGQEALPGAVQVSNSIIPALISY